MKKSFKWLLCATLVFSSALAVACGEEEVPEVHEHTWATTYSSDANGHWYAATCEHTDQKMSLALHNDANKDGVCDTCNYDTHQGAGHSYATEWSKDENNHWHAANCGHTVAGTDLGAHVDENNDKECDTCGYDYNHTHAYATTWSKDFTNHWHAATCECTIEGIDIAAHVDEDKNGVCDICQGATFDAATHTHTYATEWSKDEKNHWYAAMCDHTGLVQSVTAHNDADKDGDCDVCGWYDEAHTHTYATEWSKNDTKHWHAANCGHTGLIADEADHVMVNGECTTCGYDGNHEHTYADEWDKDDTNHWLNANCGCTLKVAVTKHDGMDDAVCDTCGWYDTTHTCAPTDGVWGYDEYEHWQYCPDHTSVWFNVDAHEGMQDGVCDVCGYKDYEDDHAHEFDGEDEWTFDFTGHWIASSCHSGVVKEGSYAEHVDLLDAENNEAPDGFCDVCGNILFDQIIADSTSADFTNLVKNGSMTKMESYEDSKDVTKTFFEYGEDCFHRVVFDSYDYWYMLDGDRIMGIMVSDDGPSKAYDTNENSLKGAAIAIGYYDNETAYGVADAIAKFYAIAKENGDMEVWINEDTMTVGFSGFNTAGEKFTVTYVVSEYEVYSYEIRDYVNYPYISEFYLTIEDDYNTTYAINQFAGVRTAATPYRPSELIATSYDFTMYALTYEDWMWNEASEASPFTTDLSIEVGTGYKFYFTGVDPTTANFSFDTFTYTINGEEYVGGIQINDGMADGYFEILIDSDCELGTYTLVVSTLNKTTTFNVTVTKPAVTEISAAQYSNIYYEMMPISELNVFVGESAIFYSMVNANANNAYTAAITSDNAEDATLTRGEEGYFGVPYTFSATVAGTYTVTLTSAENDEITGILTINVAVPPTAEELLAGYKGYYVYDDYLGANTGVGVLFTPTEEGATSGTAVIDLFDIESYWSTDVAYTTETVSYVYDAETGAVTLTHVDGVDFIANNYLEIYIQNGKVVVGIFVNAMMDFPGELITMERPEIPSVEEDEPVAGGALVGTYTATDDYGNSFDVVITDTTITFTPPMSEEVVWTYELNDGLVTLYVNGVVITMPLAGYVEVSNGVASMMYNNGTQYTLTKKVEFKGTYTATDNYGNSFDVVITDTTITFQPPRSLVIEWTYELEGDVITLYQDGMEITNPYGGSITVSGGVATSMMCNGTSYTLTK